ncbi:MAG TPA: TetR family transcriptional regulator [Saprospiraceae bacterium]|mgnify:CR=1 FL=1|nr:TetR family transcriptional regulator [Saprospiraceae bacterium]HQU52646.1 TetR family transcriptional regulator [Saprospiraceae bacterium]
MTEISPKKQQIYLEAARLFHHRGYAATSMRAIADAVDLEVSSLYSHIRSKEELLHEICFRVAGQFLEAIRQIRQKWDDPRVQLEELLRFHLRLALEDPTSATVFSDEWKHLRTDELAVFLDQRKQYEQQFLGIIREGQATGIFRDQQANWIMHTMISSLSWLYRTRTNWKQGEQEQLMALLLTMNMNGIIKSNSL